MNEMMVMGVALAVIATVSFMTAPRVRDAAGFFRGLEPDGTAPSLFTLTLSQVTTWIFARSLLTAAILGYYYGIVGGLAYAAYYLSFLTGGAIVQTIRFERGYDSIQAFLTDRFGRTGPGLYNFVVGVRLLSEVFANLLVIGLIFGEAGTQAYVAAIVVLAVLTLAYSMLGGLRAALRTDVFQMLMFLALLAVILVQLFSAPDWSAQAAAGSSKPTLEGGWNLLLVALLQVWSYPLHDPVMMDRGFVADRRTTRLSFLHAAWISILCILAFSLLGVFAGLEATDGEAMMDVLRRLLGPETLLVVNLALIVSAVSTLDSTFASSAKLTVRDMRMAEPTLRNGRIAMALFLLGGLVLLFLGSRELFDAVAVSGTASMFLAPVIFFSIWANRPIPTWSYVTSFVVAMAGATLYYVETTGMASVIEPLLGIGVKYNKLLLICVVVMVVGNAAFAIGLLMNRAAARAGAARTG